MASSEVSGEPPHGDAAEAGEVSAATAAFNEQKLLEQEDDASSGPLAEGSASAKAKAFLARKKDELISSNRAKFADVIATYDANRAFINRANMANSLFGAEIVRSYHVGDFFSTGDGRTALCAMRADFGAKSNTSYSFDPDTWNCLCCPAHHRILDKLTAPQDITAARRLFLLGDQALPPALPGAAAGMCIPVIRQEDASLKALVQLFINIVRGHRLQAGSLVAISSASHLASGGLGHYLDELAQASYMLQDFTRGEVELVLCPVFLYSGSTDRHLIRSLAELAAWIRTCTGPVAFLGDTINAAYQAAANSSTLNYDVPMERAILTLANFSEGGARERVWLSDPGFQIPCELAELTLAEEKNTISSLLTELNVKAGLVQSMPEVNRRPPPRCVSVTGDRCVSNYLVIGASNSERLAAEIANAGLRVVRIKTTNWTPTSDNRRRGRPGHPRQGGGGRQQHRGTHLPHAGQHSIPGAEHRWLSSAAAPRCRRAISY